MPVSRIEQINKTNLKPLAEKVLAVPVEEIISWDHKVLKGDPTKPDDRVVARISGSARTGKGEEPWSVILKIPNPTHTHWEARNREPFQREVLMYESGILDDLAGNIASPQCYEIWKPEKNEPWMWLEDIKGMPGRDWDIERIAVMARQFGTMQGAFMAAGPLPDDDWLDSADRVRAGHDYLLKKMEKILAGLKEHQLTRELMKADFGKKLLRLWNDKDIFLDAYYNAPRTLMHGDFCTGNFFSREDQEGTIQTVVIDWQYSGIAPVGGDMGGFIGDNCMATRRMGIADPLEFTVLMMDAYLEGFKDGGWKGNPNEIRLATYGILAIPWSICAAMGLEGLVTRRGDNAGNLKETERKLDRFIHNEKYFFSLQKKPEN